MFDVPEDRVELAASAEPKQLSEVPAGDIVALLGRDRGGYRGLYYAWEQQQWEAGSLSFADDARQWQEIGDGERAAIEAAYRAVCISGFLTDLLVPFADAVPTEEQQVFMTTVLADTARHAVLQDRFLTEIAGDASARGRSDIAGAAPLRAAATPAGVAVFGLVVSAGVAAALRFLSDQLRERGLLESLRGGINASLRDLTRHIGFARMFASEHRGGDPSPDSVLASHIPAAVAALGLPEGLPYPSAELRSYASELMSAVAPEPGKGTG
jgi:ribonucleoside-diphosphate reductase beta chain